MLEQVILSPNPKKSISLTPWGDEEVGATATRKKEQKLAKVESALLQGVPGLCAGFPSVHNWQHKRRNTERPSQFKRLGIFFCHVGADWEMAVDAILERNL